MQREQTHSAKFHQIMYCYFPQQYAYMAGMHMHVKCTSAGAWQTHGTKVVGREQNTGREVVAKLPQPI